MGIILRSTQDYPHEYTTKFIHNDIMLQFMTDNPVHVWFMLEFSYWTWRARLR